MKRTVLFVALVISATALLILWSLGDRTPSQPVASTFDSEEKTPLSRPDSFQPPFEALRVMSEQSAGTAFRLSLVGEPSGLSGDGELFVRRRNVSSIAAAERVQFHRWCGTLPMDDTEGLIWIAAVSDGVPMRIVDASNRRDVRIIVSNDHLVTVTDSTGELLDRVTIAEDARLALGPSELVHPGILRANKLLDVERGAPVWLNVPEEEQVVYWVRAAGHAYAALVLPSAESRFHHVISNPAADVQCDLDGSADPRSFAIVVACADETTIRTERLQDRSFSIGGLPPGRTIVSLVSVSDVDGPSHSISTVQLEPGTTTRLFFSPDPVRASLRGTLSGELRLPLLDQAVLQEAVLQLVVAQVRRQDGTTISGVRPRHLEVDKMAKNQAGERYLWDAGDTDPGGYRLQVQPLGYVANAWVEPGQSAAVVLDVPELSELHLAFVDESTGVPDAVTIRQVTRQVESHGEIVSPLSFCRPGGSTGSIDFIGVPGKVAFSVETEAHGAFWHVTEAVVGTHHEVVHMVMASWIDLAFIQDSADPSSFCKWFGQIEVWDSAGPSEPLWSEQRNAGEGSQASVCVRGNNAVDLRFRPDEGYPTLPDLYVAAGLPDPKEPSRTQRRRLLVPVGDSPAVDETSR